MKRFLSITVLMVFIGISQAATFLQVVPPPPPVPNSPGPGRPDIPVDFIIVYLLAAAVAYVFYYYKRNTIKN